MYEALPGEEQGGSENGFDSLVENKVSPTATPRCYYSNIFLTKCLLIGRGRKSQILRDFLGQIRGSFQGKLHQKAIRKKRPILCYFQGKFC